MQKIYTQEIHDKLYRDITEFRTLFKLPIEIKSGTFTPEDDIRHQALAVEELTELAVADTLVEQADALCDALYVNQGRIVHLGHKKIGDAPGLIYLNELIFQVATALNIDLLACWDIVHASNMSKICSDHKQYRETADFYRKQNILVEPESTLKHNNRDPSKSLSGIIVKCAQDTQTESKFIKKGKILKNVHYKAANLDPVPLLK
ncbi:nucleoside triphosphate pyrophosphohydrolase family protein [Vibrio owensii]|uniref:nucleoside triphosphate pyrophosphohydrolase family protein n=1 Tax=Vibrio owensii TaxID=696485 RepID=UPI0018F145D1|nr:nucleoside triphosphate pyrophosphohydrolase family protein [Vibrio owensii]